MNNFNILPYARSIVREFNCPEEGITAKLLSIKMEEVSWPFSSDFRNLVNFLYFGGPEVKDPSSWLSALLMSIGIKLLGSDKSPIFYIESNKEVLNLLIRKLEQFRMKSSESTSIEIRGRLLNLIECLDKKFYPKIIFEIKENGIFDISFSHVIGQNISGINCRDFDFGNYHDFCFTILMWRYKKKKKQIQMTVNQRLDWVQNF